MEKAIFLLIVFLCLLFSIGISAFMLYAAWEHNPQGEFHYNGEINWAAWLPVGIGPFVFSGGPLYLILLLYLWLKKNS